MSLPFVFLMLQIILAIFIFNTLSFNLYFIVKWLIDYHITMLEYSKLDYLRIFTNVLHIFLCSHVTNQHPLYYFSIFCKTGLVVINSLRFCLKISPSFLKDNLVSSFYFQHFNNIIPLSSDLRFLLRNLLIVFWEFPCKLRAIFSLCF